MTDPVTHRNKMIVSFKFFYYIYIYTATTNNKNAMTNKSDIAKSAIHIILKLFSCFFRSDLNSATMFSESKENKNKKLHIIK